MALKADARTGRLLSKASGALDAMGASRQRRAFHVPGRIEVLGKHTDYAGGRSLLCAVDRGIVVCVAPRSDGELRIRNADDPPTVVPHQAHWWRYASTVTGRIARDFPDARAGADIAFASDLPMDSGLSSSSALVVALFLAIDAVNGLAGTTRYRAAIPSREALGEYLGAVENGRSFGRLEAAQGVGTLGGSEDHTAILCCRANTLSRYSFCPVRAEDQLPMPHSRVFIVAFSGMGAAKAANALAQYNEASMATQELLRLWNERMSPPAPTLADALESRPDAYDAFRDALPGVLPHGFTVQRLLDRLEQFNVESRHIIPRVCDALRAGDLASFGELVDRSQANAERLLGNQVRETIALARAARTLGADAASAFGAGFGGSVWAMIQADAADAFMDTWRERYAAQFPVAAERAIFFATRAHDGASELLMENR